ncbi:DUF58 domain-containing protein [Planctomycetes bacterium K23_9]|uniref:DUF58 domain-containing protein n=1 Tax=Stieleria marina TaxID=1930275 RepID=A0A517P0M8_9BACT|nr:hypothetical protein K239x_49430 [Planctomycetes bacterium K23_9]
MRFPFRKAASTSSPSGADGEAAIADLLDPGVMEQIGHLELLSRTVVDGLLAGKHRSTTKGGCSEFSQHRQYAPGDEIRQIDWQVYARNDRYFIKQFEEETNLHAMIAVDTSGSMKFGLSSQSKLDYARRAAACLSRLLLRQRDAVGTMILNQEQPLFVPPRQHAAHLRAILSTLQMAKPGKGGELGAMIRANVPRLQRRGLFVLFSDCFGNVDDLATGLRMVRGRGHDVIVMHVVAPEELSFDFRRWSKFQSLEVDHQHISLDPPAVRREYLRRMSEFIDQLEEMVVSIGGEYVRMTTSTDLSETLGWFLRSRLARAGGGKR